MARFTVTENVVTTYKIDIDEDYLDAWKSGVIADDELFEFLSEGNPLSVSITERVIELD